MKVTFNEILNGKMNDVEKCNALIFNYGKLLNFDSIENPTIEQIYDTIIECEDAPLFEFFPYKIVKKIIEALMFAKKLGITRNNVDKLFV